MFPQVSSLWIPFIIFRNTDNDEAVDVVTTRTYVSITREGDFVRSGPEIFDEVLSFTSIFTEVNIVISFKIEVFEGRGNIITMNQTHSKKFHCSYLLHYYPFDSQVIINNY